MISKVSGSLVNSAYANNNSNVGKAKETEDVKSTVVTKQGDKSRVDEIKDALLAGEYKVDLNALSELIADELL
jgi:anti-sigma28 factor (negative regulator of flagellin synthesis)